MLTNIARRLAGWAGYEIRRKRRPVLGDIVDPYRIRIGRAIDTVRPYTMLSRARLITLYRQVQHLDVHGRRGALVECGTWKGGAVGMMALANLDAEAPPRHIHLFDAFDDLCEPDPTVDGQRILDEIREHLGVMDVQGRLRPMKGAYASIGGHGTIHEARRLLEREVGYDPHYLHFHKGWFQDTLPSAADSIGGIALLRVDGELYASVKVCLDHLFDRVVPGGFVVIDHYGYYDGCTRAVDEFITDRRLDAYLHPADHVPQCHVYWIKQ